VLLVEKKLFEHVREFGVNHHSTITLAILVVISAVIWWVIWSLVSQLVTDIIGYFPTQGDQKISRNLFSRIEIIVPLILATGSFLLLFIVKNVLSLPETLGKLSERIQLDNKLEKLDNSKFSIRGNVAGHLRRDLYKRLDVDSHNQLIACNKWAALELYELFWKELCSEQEKAKTQLKCYAIHSSSIDVWVGVDGQNFLNTQKQFCKPQLNRNSPRKDCIPGQVHRILCYPPEHFDEKAEQVAADMIGAGANVYFYSMNSEVRFSDYQFTWDFLVTENLQQSQQSVMWEAGKTGELPIEATCANHEYHLKNREVVIDLKKLWDEVRAHAKELELDDNGLVKFKE
jgi:large-conductance mechanosensitive channel